MSQKEQTARTTLAVTLVILLSKAFGFVRESIVAAYFGTRMQADAYAAAYGTYYVPILLFGSCISSTLIPLYVQTRTDRGLRAANRLASNAVNIFTSFGLMVAAAMYLLADPLIGLLYGGFGPEQHHLAVELMRIMLPALFFAIAALVLMNILNAQERFVVAQLTGFPLSVCVVLAAVLFSRKFGAQSLAWGVFCAAILQVAIQLPALRKSFRYRWVFDPADPAIRRMLRLAVPAILSMSATEINNIVDKSMASGLEVGAISAMNYAFRLVTFVQGVLVVPLMTVMFSRMSGRAAKKDAKGVVELFRECAEAICAIVLPVTIIASVLSRGVIRFAFMRGAFNEHSLMLTSGVFAMYILGETAFGIRDLLNRVFHSMQDTKTPMFVALFMIIINIILNLICVRFLGLNGLALSTTISGVVSVALLMLLLRRRTGPIGMRSSAMEFLRIAAASLIAGAVCYVLSSLKAEPHGLVPLIGYLALVGGGSALVYLAAAWLLGSRNIRNLRAIIRRRTN